jgi:hypothetical protein
MKYTRIFDIKITTPSEGSRREVPLAVVNNWDDLRNLLYSLLALPTEIDYINIIITPLEVEPEEAEEAE